MAVKSDRIMEFAANVDRQITRTMGYVGNEFQKNARNAVTQSIYERPVKDKDGNPRARRPWELTGNLLASIGYTVAKDGQRLIGETNHEKAERLISELITDGHQLVMVAGMEYAAAVESKGYDVITESAKKADARYKRMLKANLKAAAR